MIPILGHSRPEHASVPQKNRFCAIIKRGQLVVGLSKLNLSRKINRWVCCSRMMDGESLTNGILQLIMYTREVASVDGYFFGIPRR